MRCNLPTILALSSMLTVPTTAMAQDLDVKGLVTADLEAMQTKFVDLAGAMQSDQYGWRPMEGVRSVSEVYMLIAAENYYIPSIWDAEAAEGAVTFQTMNAVTETVRRAGAPQSCLRVLSDVDQGFVRRRFVQESRLLRS